MNPFKFSITHILQNVFGILPTERKRALLMQANIFLIITTLLIVKPLVTSLFLSRFGVDRLPVAFIFVAIAAALVSTVYSRLLARFSLRKIFHRSTLISVISLVTFGVLLKAGVFVGQLLFVFYVWVAIFALLSTSQFWVMANMVFNAREAKRLFGFIGAGAIAGGIFGGYLASSLAGLISSENLTFVAAGMLTFCLPITREIWKKHLAPQSAATTFNEPKTKFSDHSFRLILQSEHLMYIAGIVGASVVVAKLVDYQFNGVAAMLFPDQDKLTAFLGFWFSTFNLLSLLLQLFLTRRIMGTFGVGASLFFLPVLILIATILMLVMPELLMAAVFLKMADGSLKQSINKAAIELVIMPIPADVKNRTKTFIDVFIDSLATGFSGLLLLGVEEGLDLSTRYVSLLILVFIGIWLYLAKKVQREYVRSFKIKLEASYQKNRVVNRKFDLKSPAALEGFRRMLKKDNEEQLIFVLRKLRKIKRKDFVKPLTQLLIHRSAEVRAEAVSTLYYYRNEEVVSEIIPLTEDGSPIVKAYAFEYLLAHSTNGSFELIEEYLYDPDEWIRSAALVTLAREHRKKPRRQHAKILEKRIREKLSEIANEPELLSIQRKLTLAKAIGFARLNVLHSHLFALLEDPDEAVAKQAILAAGDTQNPIFIECLVRLLADDKLRPNAQQALATFDQTVVPELKQVMDMPTFPIEALRHVPANLKLIPSQASVDYLFELLDHADAMIRREALRSLNSLHNDFPDLQFGNKEIVRRIIMETKLYQQTRSVLFVQKKLVSTDIPTDQETKVIAARKQLIKLLGQRLDRNLERIFRLLGLKYPAEDILIIYYGLKSNEEERRANALEFLDNLLEPNLKRTIIPLIESTMLETISMRAIHRFQKDVPNEYTCFQQLLDSKDVVLKRAVITLIRQMGESKYLALIEGSAQDDAQVLQGFLVNYALVTNS